MKVTEEKRREVVAAIGDLRVVRGNKSRWCENEMRVKRRWNEGKESGGERANKMVRGEKKKGMIEC